MAQQRLEQQLEEGLGLLGLELAKEGSGTLAGLEEEVLEEWVDLEKTRQAAEEWAETLEKASHLSLRASAQGAGKEDSLAILGMQKDSGTQNGTREQDFQRFQGRTRALTSDN